MDGVRIRRAEDFFNEFAYEKLYKQGKSKSDVKKELVNEFQKEIFGIVAMRAKKRFDQIPPEGDPEALRIAANVIKDETKKWKKLVGMFNANSVTRGCITMEDLSMIPEKGNGELGFENGELVKRPDDIEASVDDEEVETEVTDAVEDLETVRSGYAQVIEELEDEDIEPLDPGVIVSSDISD